MVSRVLVPRPVVPHSRSSLRSSLSCSEPAGSHLELAGGGTGGTLEGSRGEGLADLRPPAPCAPAPAQGPRPPLLASGDEFPTALYLWAPGFVFTALSVSDRLSWTPSCRHQHAQVKLPHGAEDRWKSVGFV